MLYAFLIAPMREHTRQCHPHLITLVIVREEYKLWNFLPRIFLNPPVISSLLGPNILLSPPFSNTTIYVFPYS
jgi:hypothetical protein